MVRGSVGIPLAGLIALLAAAPAFGAPANDDFADAEVIFGELPVRVGGGEVGATREPGEPVHGDSAGDGSVWFRWTPSGGGRVTIGTCGTTQDTQLAVYTGASLAALDRVASNDDNPACSPQSGVAFTANAGQTYSIAVDHRKSEYFYFEMSLGASGTPENDNIVAAIPLTPASGAPASASGSTTGATAEGREFPHNGEDAWASVWYWWRAGQSGEHTIDTCASSFRSRVEVFRRASGLPVSRAAGPCAGMGRRVKVDAVAGTTYVIAVDGVDRSSGGFQLSVRPPLPRMRFAEPAPVVEGDSGQTDAVFRVELDRPFVDPVRVDYIVARPHSGFFDWEPTEGELRFAPGETEKKVVVKVNGDIADERDEEYIPVFLRADTVENALMGTNSLYVPILDDDGPPPLGWECYDLFCLAPGEGPVRMSRSKESAELVRTVPVTRRGKPRAVMEVGPKALGPIGRGAAVEASGEVEVSVTCLERMRKCVGTRYGYSPAVSGRLVLQSDGRRAKRVRLSRTERLKCSQALPHRNHHCVLVFPPSRAKVRSGCSGCRVVLRLEAKHARAQPGNRLVIGADSNRGIAQDKGHLNAVVIEPGASKPRRKTDRKRWKRSVPVGRRGASGRRFVVHSYRLDGLQAHEQLFFDARARIRTGHLPYGAFIGADVVVADSPTSVEPSNGGGYGGSPLLDVTPAEKNGFNCTRGRSAHRSPCLVRKLGFLRVQRTWPPTKYLNLVVQTAARYGGRWRERHRAKVLKGGGITIDRYDPLGWSRITVPPKPRER